MTVIDCLLKRDRSGNYPLWWQLLFPRYGNWGGPGWSAGRWNPDVTDWGCAPVNAMDSVFREHDRVYQGGGDLDWADSHLVEELEMLSVTGVYDRVYRVGAIAAFSLWPWIRSAYKGEIMKKAAYVMLALIFFATVFIGISYAGEVPGITPADFDGSTSVRMAHPIWGILAGDGFWGAVLIGVVGFVYRWLRPTILAYMRQRDLESMYLACETFVGNSKVKYTDRYKAANDDGKLTQEEAEEIFYRTKQDFVIFMQSQGKDVVKVYGDRFIDAMIEFILSQIKLPKAVSLPLGTLSGSAPLPPSVMDGAMPA